MGQQELNKEIERKFLLKSSELLADKGPLTFSKETSIKQFYMDTEKSSNHEIRLRQENEKEYLTIKSGQGLVRTEQEFLIEKGAYETRRENHNVKDIKKIRRYYNKFYKGEKIEVVVDIYEDIKLVVMEIEFSSVEKAKNFDPTILPFDIVREVTGEKAYSNKVLFNALNIEDKEE